MSFVPVDQPVHDLMIRPAQSADAAGVCAIYNHYVANTVATFEEACVPIDAMAQRIESTLATGTGLVAECDGAVAGYAYAKQWKARSAYRYSVESSVYIAPARIGLGIGTALYAELIDALQRCGRHSVVACIALPNDGSIRLHEKFGFTQVAHFRECGFKFGRWVDVGYWQRRV